MKKKTIFLTALAAGLLLSSSINSAWAYFTTYAEAKGGYTLEMGEETTIHEDFSAWKKHVSISVSEDSKPVYIRAKAFCGSEYELVYSDESGKWTPGEDGYYYYSDIVNPGGVTDELVVTIQNVPEDVISGDSFDVVVIYESTPVLYDENGSPYADWSVKLDSGNAEGGGQS